MKKFALAAVVGLFAAGAAQAQVVNGSFETGDFTGWTQIGDTGFTGVWDFDSQDGEYNAYFGPLSVGGIEQAIPGNAGDQIEVSFWVRSETGGTPNSMTATLDGQLIAAELDITDGAWQQFTGTVTVGSANPVLQFTFSNPSDYTDLDNVTASMVPAPGAMALLGLGGVMAARRRRN